jgi:endonuclease/exonuclease/phosphatase family metal-dependent hydrolase
MDSMAPLRVVTYNVRHAVLDDGQDAWDRRRDGVVERLRASDPDVIALQECAGEQQKELAAALSPYEWVGVAETPGSGEHNPVGIGPRLSLADATTDWLSESGDTGSVGWDAAYPRVLTTTLLEDRQTGCALAVYNTHFDHVFLTRACEVRGYAIDATTADGRFPSDHLPVVVDVSVPAHAPPSPG